MLALEKQQQEENALLEKEKKMQQAMLDIKKKFGKNAILKGMNLQEGTTTIERNKTDWRTQGIGEFPGTLCPPNISLILQCISLEFGCAARATTTEFG